MEIPEIGMHVMNWLRVRANLPTPKAVVSAVQQMLIRHKVHGFSTYSMFDNPTCCSVSISMAQCWLHIRLDLCTHRMCLREHQKWRRPPSLWNQQQCSVIYRSCASTPPPPPPFGLDWVADSHSILGPSCMIPALRRSSLWFGWSPTSRTRCEGSNSLHQRKEFVCDVVTGTSCGSTHSSISRIFDHPPRSSSLQVRIQSSEVPHDC